MKTFTMGDIHGAHKALIQCLERSGFDKEVDTLIFLGDVCDGWEETPECIEELLSIKNLIPLMGNHDKWTEEWMTQSKAPTIWLTQGGEATFYAYVERYPELIVKHVNEYFPKTVLYHVDDQNRGFVHGGYTSKKGLGHEPSTHDYYWDRSLVNLAFMLRNTGWTKAKVLQSHKEIYVGHTATTSLKHPYKSDKPIKFGNLTMMDTGAGWPGGKLTIMDIDSQEYWQSDEVSTLYPNSHGRR